MDPKIQEKNSRARIPMDLIFRKLRPENLGNKLRATDEFPAKTRKFRKRTLQQFPKFEVKAGFLIDREI